jgi:hypothetical protein
MLSAQIRDRKGTIMELGTSFRKRLVDPYSDYACFGLITPGSLLPFLILNVQFFKFVNVS